ncbi:MAG: hypothetical protein GF411_10125 [Candidatus Lokiarchaeota archaeon]|nr:hypothetical protein [Candidatus Lokiarchaeota archaeon]
MDANAVLEMLKQVRKELNLTRGVTPKIIDVHDDIEGNLHIVTSDRSEKSLFVGPRGRIVAEFAKRLDRHISIYGQDEILLRNHRLELTKERIEELLHLVQGNQYQVLKTLLRYLQNELNNFDKEIFVPESSVNVGVSFSGGVDSGASLILAQRIWLKPTAITVDPGVRFLAPHIKEWIIKWCDEMGIPLKYVDSSNLMDTILEKAATGQMHPCNHCHEIIMKKARETAKENGLSTLITGEMLPTGRQSIIIDQEILIINLPAALSLTKHDTRQICSPYDFIGSKGFGCHVVKSAHQKRFGMVEASIFRVLRELQAGILSTGQALAFINKILRESS